MFKKNNGKVYYVNAYYDVIDDVITIYIFLEKSLCSMMYIKNDVIMCSNITYFPDIYFLA